MSHAESYFVNEYGSGTIKPENFLDAKSAIQKEGADNEKILAITFKLIKSEIIVDKPFDVVVKKTQDLYNELYPKYMAMVQSSLRQRRNSYFCPNLRRSKETARCKSEGKRKNESLT